MIPATPMQPKTPLRLRSFWIDRLSIGQDFAERKLDQEPETTLSNFDYDHRKLLEQNSFEVALRLSAVSTRPAQGIELWTEISLRGVFSLPETFTDEVVGKYVPVQCLANLYGTARGVIASHSGMLRGGPIVLPVANIFAAVKELDERRLQLLDYAETDAVAALEQRTQLPNQLSSPAQ